MGLEDDFLLEDADDEKTVEFIKNYLPQELKEKFEDDELYYFLDLIAEYYSEYDPEEILFVVQGEMEYGNSLGQVD